MYCLCSTVAFWLFGAHTNWDCEIYRAEGDTTPQVPCNTVEDWLGAISDFVLLSFFGIFMRLGIVIVFASALCRINCLVGDLKKYGFVSSTKILRIHVMVSVVGLILNLVVGIWTLGEASEAMSSTVEKGKEGYAPP